MPRNGCVTKRDAQQARVRRREARWCWRRWDLTINMMWGERVGGGKTAKTTTEEGEMPCGQRSGGNGGRGGRLQSLQGEKSCLHLHGCSASRDKVSGFATPNDDGRSTLAWSGGVRKGQNDAKPILLIPKANGNAHAAMGGTLYQSLNGCRTLSRVYLTF